MSDTADTICSASQTLIDKGALDVVAIITHGILSGDAIERINSSCLSKVYPKPNVGDCVEYCSPSRTQGQE